MAEEWRASDWQAVSTGTRALEGTAGPHQGETMMSQHSQSVDRRRFLTAMAAASAAVGSAAVFA